MQASPLLYQRVLITGANGLLGQELVSLMSGKPEYDVLATGRSAAPQFRGASCGYTQLDITDTSAMRRLFQDFTPTVVVNCAAMTQVDGCEVARDACWRVNAESVEHLAKQCRVLGARLVQVSTDFVFSGENGPYHEEGRPDPVNFYGKAKLAAENATRESGLDAWAVARTVLVYGSGENLRRSNFALWVIDKLGKGEPINVVTDQWRTPTYAPDLADGIERIVRFGKTGTFHISGRELISIYDFAQTIARVFDLDASLIHSTDSTQFKQEAARPARTGFIILKAETELGYKPRSLEDALRHLGSCLGLPVTS
jgi:dTDP-4-dehydrorhamnose reductase